VRLLILAMFATLCVLTSVGSAQTAGPTVARGSGAAVKSAPGKHKLLRRTSKKRVAHRRRAVPAKAVPKPAAARVPTTRA
jgi:hypothetical protein